MQYPELYGTVKGCAVHIRNEAQKTFCRTLRWIIKEAWNFENYIPHQILTDNDHKGRGNFIVDSCGILSE